MTQETTQDKEPRGVAYSYVRFSTAKQELGDSLRRQVEMAEKYCLKHNLELHPVSYRDLGVSAFKRKNLEKGALSAFIDAVTTGKVPKGSYLVIEQFDRMSRAETSTALQLLLNLVKAGIKVVTLSDEKVWDSDTINDTGNLVLAIVYMSRANNESQAKADRLSAIWGRKMLAASKGTANRIVTSECPRWLKPNADKTGFFVLEDKVESIRKVFEMRINGNGVTRIVSRANEEQWPCPGKPPVQKSGETPAEFEVRRRSDAVTWHTSTVGRLLKNRALLGEYQPFVDDPEHEGKRKPHDKITPVLGYYPAVLDEVTFLRAQAKANRSGRFPGRRDASLKNWLQGLLRCTCGHSFVRKNKDSKAQPEYARYYCTARNRQVRRPDGTLCPGVDAKQLEGAVLTVVSTVAPQFFKGTAKMDELSSRADLIEVDLDTAKLSLNRLMEALEDGKGASKSISARVRDKEAEIERLEKELAAVRAEVADLSGDFDDVFENIVRQVKSIDSLDARAKLREELSRVVDRVIVHEPQGFIEVFLRGEDVPVVQPLRIVSSVPGLTFTTMTEEEHKQMLDSLKGGF